MALSLKKVVSDSGQTWKCHKCGVGVRSSFQFIIWSQSSFPFLSNDQCLVAEQGVYEFPRLTLLGFDTNEPQVRRLSQLGLKVFVHHLSADIHYKLGSAGKFHLVVVAGEGRGQQTRGRRDWALVPFPPEQGPRQGVWIQVSWWQTFLI